MSRLTCSQMDGQTHRQTDRCPASLHCWWPRELCPAASLEDYSSRHWHHGCVFVFYLENCLSKSEVRVIYQVYVISHHTKITQSSPSLTVHKGCLCTQMLEVLKEREGGERRRRRIKSQSEDPQFHLWGLWVKNICITRWSLTTLPLL